MTNLEALRNLDENNLQKIIAIFTAKISRELVKREFQNQVELEISKFILADIEQGVQKWLHQESVIQPEK